ncbi:unnamed protein product, partial [Allacma fusca]
MAGVEVRDGLNDLKSPGVVGGSGVGPSV